jgi:hypothetical protein
MRRKPHKKVHNKDRETSQLSISVIKNLQNRNQKNKRIECIVSNHINGRQG